MSINKRVLTVAERIAKPVFILLIIAFFIVYLRDIDFAQFGDISIDWTALIIASIISLGFRYWGVVIWRIILSDLGARHLPPFSTLSNVYAKAWMGRYIPGTVTWIAGKIYMASKLGISKSRLAVSSLLEGGMQVVATMSVSLLILGLDPRLNVISTEIKMLMALIGILSTVALLPPIFNRLLSAAYMLIKRQPAGKELATNSRTVVRSYVLYAVGTLIMGSSYYFLVAALTPDVSPDMYLYFVGAFSLSGALGMATPFVPSGLGVRDGVQLVLLSIVFPKEIALLITVFSRLWSAVIDVLFYAVASALYRLKNKKA